MKHRILGVVPARAGSQRLKNKNFMPLKGKPLVEHTIDAAVDSQCLAKIVVSTDSPEVSEVAENKDVEVIKRSPEFASSSATVVSAIIDLMKSTTEKYDFIAYFLPTCPLRNSEDIKKGIELLADADSVISTTTYSSPIQLAMIEGDSGVLYPVFDNLRAGLTNSHYIQKHVRPNGGFYISRWESVLESGHFFNGRVRGYKMSQERSIDIDTLEDIKFAELLMSAQ